MPIDEINNLRKEVATLSARSAENGKKLDTLIELVRGPEVPDPKELVGLVPMVTHIWQCMFVGRECIDRKVRIMWEDRLKRLGMAALAGTVGGVVSCIIYLICHH